MSSSISMHLSQGLGPVPRGSWGGSARASGQHEGDLPRSSQSGDHAVESVRNVRFAASYDRAAGRVVTRVIDQRDGRLVHQIPDEDALRVLTGIREMVGITVDELI
jgi:uncharacterized FlaG/YvyC family protein